MFINFDVIWCIRRLLIFLLLTDCFGNGIDVAYQSELQLLCKDVFWTASVKLVTGDLMIRWTIFAPLIKGGRRDLTVINECV